MAYTYYYPDYDKGTPMKIVASSQSEAREKAKAQGLSTKEVLPSWKGLGRRDPESVKGTMSTKGGEKISLSLPTGELDQTSLLQMALRDIGQQSYRTGVSEAVRTSEEKLGEMGLGAEQTRAPSAAGIIDFVESRVREPVTRAMETASFMVSRLQEQKEKEKDRARGNLEYILNVPRGLSRMSSSEIRNLADVAEIDSSLLTSIRDAQEANWEAEQQQSGVFGEMQESQARTQRIDRFLQARIGGNLKGDTFVSAETYYKAHKQWIAGGGTERDWELFYPFETWLRPSEIDRLKELYPSVYGGGGEITVEDISLSNR